MKIIWSEKAKHSFAEILDFLEHTWGEKQIKDFYLLTDKVLSQIQSHPYQFKASTKRKNVRKGLIHKNVSLYYKVNSSPGEILLLFFFDNRSEPTGL